MNSLQAVEAEKAEADGDGAKESGDAAAVDVEMPEMKAIAVEQN